MSAIEAGKAEPRVETLARVGAALGLDVSLRFFPNTGPLIRDHIQAAMIEALVSILHVCWRPIPEVAVQRARMGSIDLVLEPGGVRRAADEPPVTCEAQSELRRLEQKLRWLAIKADALAQERDRPTTVAAAVDPGDASRDDRVREDVRCRLPGQNGRCLRGAGGGTELAGVGRHLVRRRPWPSSIAAWATTRHLRRPLNRRSVVRGRWPTHERAQCRRHQDTPHHQSTPQSVEHQEVTTWSASASSAPASRGQTMPVASHRWATRPAW